MTLSISTLQAAAGRFLTASGPVAWESESRQRTTNLVRAFQAKQLEPDGLRAALASERSGPPTPSKPKAVALLELMGILTPHASIFSLLGFGTAVAGFMRQLAAAAADPEVKSIVVVVDSPGGLIRLMPEAANLMRIVRRRKPVVVSVGGMDASAAYWITAGATAIEATPSASVGAIGIVTQRASITRMLEREGIDVEVFAAGKYKAEGHEATPITDGERAYIQAQVDKAYGDFVNDVASGRQTAPTVIRAGYGEGRLVSADEAVRLGMIDRMSLVEETIGRAVSAPGSFAAVQARRAEGFDTAMKQVRAQQASAEIAERRRALVAAARGSAAR